MLYGCISISVGGPKTIPLPTKQQSEPASAGRANTQPAHNVNEMLNKMLNVELHTKHNVNTLVYILLRGE